MIVEPLSIEGAWIVTPRIHTDPRGEFLEWFKEPIVTTAIGRPFTLVQANCSVSASGVVRGVHFAATPPGQAKYVTCVRGSVVDVIVDIRVGSPTFGEWVSVKLDDVGRRAVYVSEGLGHGFCSLEDGSTVVYLCNEKYDHERERSVHPLDSSLSIDWGLESRDALISERDSAAPSFVAALEAGLLPRY